MAAREELLDLVNGARGELTAVTDRLHTRLGEVADADGKTVRELLVHFAGWQRVAARRIGTKVAGGETQPIDADAYNPLLSAIGAFWTDDEALWEFEDAYGRLVEAVRSAPEAACRPEGWAYRWAERTGRSHYPDHLPDLARLAAKG